MPSRRGLTSSLTLSFRSLAQIAIISEESFARAIWKNCRPEALFALYTPFVVCISAGDLDFETYVQYIFQDIQYGKTAVEVTELALKSADDDVAKKILTMFKEGDEKGTEESQEWLDENRPGACYPINIATKTYQNFLKDTANGKIEGYDKPFTGSIISVFTIAALIPCWKLYYFIGRKIVAAVGDYQDNPYKDWIAENSDSSLTDEIQQLENGLDHLTASLTTEEKEIVQKLYRKGMQCEIEFFLIQPLNKSTVVPVSRSLISAKESLLLFSNFDWTCAVACSSAFLANVQIATSSSGKKAEWGHLFAQHKEEYEQRVNKISGSDKQAYDYDVVVKALKPFSAIEKRANCRVIDSKALKDMNLEDIKKHGSQIIILNDCKNLFQAVVEKEELDASIHVISFCWCDDLIKLSVNLDALKVHANQLEFNGSTSTGNIIRSIESPAEKVQVFNDIIKNNTKTSKLTIYASESIGDLLCLLKADIGIVIGSSSSLKRAGNQVGVTFKPLFASAIAKQKTDAEGDWKAGSSILYKVSSWSEIHAFVLGWKSTLPNA